MFKHKYAKGFYFGVSLFALILSLSPEAIALETAKVLPKGVRRFWFVGIESNTVTERFNSTGEVAQLSVSNRTLNMNDFMKSEPKLKTLVHNLNQIQAGLGDSIEANTNLFHDLGIQRRILIPTLNWGLSEKLTLGVRTEVQRTRINSDFSASSSSNASQVKAILGKQEAMAKGVWDGLSSLEAEALNTEFLTKRVFTEKGYKAPTDEEYSEFGDMELGLKYSLYANQGTFAALLGRVVIPTGTTGELDNPFYTGSGNGAWGAGLEAYYETSFFDEWFTIGAAAKHRHYFKDTRARAVPLEGDDSLPSLLPEAGQVQDVTRSSGEELRTELSLQVNLPGKRFKVWGSHQLWLKGEDSYEGPTVIERALDYGALGKDSNYELQMWEFGTRFSTIQMYYDKQIKVPFEVDLSYNTAFKGKNIRKADYGRVDFKLYF